LLPVFASCGTGATSTFSVVLFANGTWPRSRKTSVFVWPGSITWIFCVFTIGCWGAGRWIVSVTSIPTSCALPEFLTPTEKARSVVAMIVFSVSVESESPLGSAFTNSSADPCGPVPPVPPVEAPRMRGRIPSLHAAGVASDESSRKFESGTSTPVIPWSRISVCDGSWKRSSQTTSLATSRCDCCASSSASLPPDFVRAEAANVAAMPSRPLRRNWSASTTAWFSARSAPGGFSSCARSISCCCRCERLRSDETSSAGLTPCVVSAVCRSRPTAEDALATLPTSRI
jgi:hypothetical protein